MCIGIMKTPLILKLKTGYIVISLEFLLGRV